MLEGYFFLLSEELGMLEVGVLKHCGGDTPLELLLSGVGEGTSG